MLLCSRSTFFKAINVGTLFHVVNVSSLVKYSAVQVLLISLKQRLNKSVADLLFRIKYLRLYRQSKTFSKRSGFILDSFDLFLRSNVS